MAIVIGMDTKAIKTVLHELVDAEFDRLAMIPHALFVDEFEKQKMRKAAKDRYNQLIECREWLGGKAHRATH